MSKPFVIAIDRFNSGVTYHRISSPLKHLRDLGEIDLKMVGSLGSISAHEVKQATHIIFSRFINTKNPVQVVEFLKKHGVKIIVDQDDWWELPIRHVLKDSYDKGIKHQIKFSNHVADEVWVTHSELAKKVDNRNVQIIPNAINHHEEQWKTPKTKSDKIRFGYLGGKTHTDDLLSSKIDLEYSDNSYCIDVENFPDIIKAGNKIEGRPVNEYAESYSLIDVSLVPLNVGAFNRCKSNLKLLEAGFTNTAAIVSSVFPYTQIIKPDNCIAIPKGGDWNKSIKNLTKDQVEELAHNLKEDVWEYRMDNVNLKRLKRLRANIK